MDYRGSLRDEWDIVFRQGSWIEITPYGEFEVPLEMELEQSDESCFVCGDSNCTLVSHESHDGVSRDRFLHQDCYQTYKNDLDEYSYVFEIVTVSEHENEIGRNTRTPIRRTWPPNSTVMVEKRVVDFFLETIGQLDEEKTIAYIEYFYHSLQELSYQNRVADFFDEALNDVTDFNKSVKTNQTGQKRDEIVGGELLPDEGGVYGLELFYHARLITAIRIMRHSSVERPAILDAGLEEN